MWKSAVIFFLLSLFVYSFYVPPLTFSDRPYLLSLKLSCLTLSRSLGKIGYLLGFGFVGRTTDSIANLIDPGLHSNEYYDVMKTILDGVPADIITPKTKAAYSPAFFFLHGGGWVQYTKVAYREIPTEFAKKLSYVSIVLDYPLAPEFPYPIPFEASLKAVIYFIKNAKKFGVDPSKIIIAGDSAGGNLAAAVSIKLAAMKDIPQPKLQILIYPVLQALDFNTPSYLKNKDDILLPKSGLLKAWLLYLFGEDILNQDFYSAVDVLSNNNHIDEKDVRKLSSRVDFSKLLGYSQKYESISKLPENVLTGKRSGVFLKAVHDPFLSPLTGATDEQLKSMAPVYLVTCIRDILHDEGIMYKKRLEQVGNPVVRHDDYDHIHGLPFLHLPESQRALNRIIDFIKSSKLMD